MSRNALVQTVKKDLEELKRKFFSQTCGIGNDSIPENVLFAHVAPFLTEPTETDIIEALKVDPKCATRYTESDLSLLAKILRKIDTTNENKTLEVIRTFTEHDGIHGHQHSTALHLTFDQNTNCLQDILDFKFSISLENKLTLRRRAEIIFFHSCLLSFGLLSSYILTFSSIGLASANVNMFYPIKALGWLLSIGFFSAAPLASPFLYLKRYFAEQTKKADARLIAFYQRHSTKEVTTHNLSNQPTL